MMSRSRKINKNKDKIEVPAVLQVILEDVVETSSMPFDEWFSLSPFPAPQLAIPVSNNREYRVTQRGVDAAHKLTEDSWCQNKEFSQTVNREKFNRLSFQAIGDTLLNSPSHLSESMEGEVPDSVFDAMALDYSAYLKDLVNASLFDAIRHIPCHLFHSDQKVPEFKIGPVHFFPRSKWIEKYVLNSTEKQYVLEVESGVQSIEKLREQSSRDSKNRELMNAIDVLRFLRNYSWVATVQLRKHDLTQSHSKASIIVGLAIDALGLRFHKEDAVRFSKAGRQHLFNEDRVATLPDGKFLYGWSSQLPGIGGRPGSLVEKMEAEAFFFNAAGNLLSIYLDGRQTGAALHLVERWVNALYWVGEARRELSDFMAVIDYGCAVDGLTGASGTADEISSFVQSALVGDAENSPESVVKINEMVDRVYREGRNKLAHGESPGLFEDLHQNRHLGEELLSILMNVVTVELSEYLEEKLDTLSQLDYKIACRALKERLHFKANQAAKRSKDF